VRDRIICVGRNNVDVILDVELGRLRPDTKQPSGPARIVMGGQCMNAAATLAALGESRGEAFTVVYAGVTGDDENGVRVREFLTERGIDGAGCITAVGLPNTAAYILLDRETGERSIVETVPEDYPPYPSSLPESIWKGASYAYFDGMDMPGSVAIAQEARERGVPTLCDVEVVSEDTLALIAACDTVILPRAVATEIAGTNELKPMLQKLVALGARRAAVTMGAEGSVGLDGAGESCRVDAVLPESIVDTTGAGDAFHAGFLFADISGAGFEDALRFGAAIAAVKCAHAGPSSPPEALHALGAGLMPKLR
jgi:sugar/nucleoside kinase (ribokinase family)